VLQDTDHATKTDAEKRAAINVLFEQYQRSFPSVESVTPSQLRTLETEGDTVLVDVRTPEERAVAVIPRSISQDEFEARAEEYTGKKIVAYCTIGYRSGQYAASLREKGFDACNLKGSILSWVHEGGKVVDPKGRETHTVHVYGEEWNLLPGGYKGVW
jgi:sodium/bile acid cotransporter 7